LIAVFPLKKKEEECSVSKSLVNKMAWHIEKDNNES